MPGAYAHMTLVNILSESARLKKLANFSRDAAKAVMTHFKYCELGAVSPDYPYLAIDDRGASTWADLMHYEKTGMMIHAGIEHLRTLEGISQQKGLAWLLGYSAHVATDVTIHPVVELKVGPYHGNEKNHRICEMHQDSHIFQQLNLGDIGLSEHLDSGIGKCSQDGERGQLDHVIEQMWRYMLSTVHVEEYKKNPPDINRWHSRFMFMVDKIAEEGNKLLPIARHLAVNSGLTYPAPENIDSTFIRSLAVPNGTSDYDQIFDRAIENVGNVWQTVASGVLDNNDEYLTFIGSWDLDTGRDENDNLVFWS